MAAPARRADGSLIFADAPSFRPNLTPAEVLALGSFGGTYFRDIRSAVTGQQHRETWKELPAEWLHGLDIKSQVASSKYNVRVNRYKVDCGAKLDKKDDPCGLLYWEKAGWIDAQDPYGHFQWYCRFFQGRRSQDDARQISRWAKCAGVTGRWRRNLITKVLHSDKAFDDESISPVVRQTLQHWAYRLSEADYKAGLRRLSGTRATSGDTDDEEPAAGAAEASGKRKRESDGAARDSRAAKRLSAQVKGEREVPQSDKDEGPAASNALEASTNEATGSTRARKGKQAAGKATLVKPEPSL
jgi:hypothetical protein